MIARFEVCPFSGARIVLKISSEGVKEHMKHIGFSKKMISMLVALSVLAALAVPFSSMAAICSHVYTGKVITPASCLDEGELEKTCTKCGNTFTEKIEAHGHTNSTVWEINEECTEMWHNCRFCGQEGTHRPYVAPNTKPGRVQVYENEVYVDGIKMNGNAGICYYDAFTAFLGDKTGYARETYLELFDVLVNDYGINYIRFDAIAFHFTAFQKYWIENRDIYFAKMDQFMADAEEAGMMLIPSILWNWGMPPELCGEDHSAWGDPTSGTFRVMLDTFEEFVIRYKDSPAILMWEMGNEYAYSTDLTNVVNNGHVYATLSDHEKCREEVVKIIRYFDPYRPISSGDSIPRSSQWNLYENGTWEVDTYEDMAKALEMLNPDGMDISIHVYDWMDTDQRGRPYYDPTVWTEEGADRIAYEMIYHCKKVADDLGKILYVGEYAGEMSIKKQDGMTDEEMIAAGTEYISWFVPLVLDACYELDIQLSTYWSTFTNGHQGHEFNEIRPDSVGGFVLDILGEHNARCAQKPIEYLPGYGEDTATDPVAGDFDRLNGVTVIDAVVLMRYISGYDVASVTEDNGDLNGDGKVDNRDVTVILRKLAGWN